MSATDEEPEAAEPGTPDTPETTEASDPDRPEATAAAPDGGDGDGASAAEPESASGASTTEPTEPTEPVDGDGDGDGEGEAAGVEAPTAESAPAAAAGAEPEPVRSSAAERAQRAAAARAKPEGGLARSLKRYGPFVAVVVIVAGAIAIFGGGGGGDDDNDQGGGGGGNQAAGEITTDPASIDNDRLVRDGPMTPEKADLLGEDVDFGPNCDTETGRIKLPSILAPPCVQPFEGDNGGATSPGVTADEVLVIRYETDPDLDPLGASIASGGGADVNPETTNEALENYARLYQSLFETYGRTVKVERFVGTGASDDREAAVADARAIAEREPFAVIGGPAQATSVFSTELASAGVICGGGCSIAEPEAAIAQYPNLIYDPGPTPEQGGMLAAEAIGNLAGPGKAEMAGDDATRAKDRVYALVHYDNPDGDYEHSTEALTAALADNGIELETDVEFFLDLARAQENARTIITRLKEAGVTTIIYSGDPFTPGPLTIEATAQDYHPEWILGPNVLADSAFFARMMDPEQWSHGFGVSFIAGRGAVETDDSWNIYRWAFGEDPPNNTVAVSEPQLRGIFTGIQMAGPELTPEKFRDGLFIYPPSGGGPTVPLVSRGSHDIWPQTDLGGTDDVTLIWWDPEASGEDEIGTAGDGLYRYANGGERYTVGNLPTSLEASGLFDDDSSVTIYDELPPEDTPPDYPAPDID